MTNNEEDKIPDELVDIESELMSILDHSPSEKCAINIQNEMLNELKKSKRSNMMYFIYATAAIITITFVCFHIFKKTDIPQIKKKEDNISNVVINKMIDSDPNIPSIATYRNALLEGFDALDDLLEKHERKLLGKTPDIDDLISQTKTKNKDND